MPEEWLSGDWLLIDAAGPTTLVALIRDGGWLERRIEDGEALEVIGKHCGELLAANTLKPADLRGCLFASGPGSTLGLRLGAMFLRSLMQLPAQKNWKCFCYNNLGLACASISKKDEGITAMAAPWRRDRFHVARLDPSSGESPIQFSWSTPEVVFESQIQIVELGRRPPRLSEKVQLIPYPIDEIPRLMQDWPMLLQECRQPSLYTAEEPEFAKWSPQRHGAP